MKIESNQITAILITFALLIAIMPIMIIPASAASDYATLQALTSAPTGGNLVQLTQNLEGNTQLTIGRSLALDLNGHSLTIDLPDVFGPPNETTRNSNGIKINSGATLTIIDSNPGANKLTVINNSIMSSVGNGAAINTTDGTLIIESGTIVATGSGDGAGVGGGRGGNGGNIIINGGTVTATGFLFAAGMGGGIGGSGGNVIINGGFVTATSTTIATVTPETGAGIGAGSNIGLPPIPPNGGTLMMNGNAVVFTNTLTNMVFPLTSVTTDTTGVKNGVLFVGNAGAVYGNNVTLAVDLTIPAEYTSATIRAVIEFVQIALVQYAPVKKIITI